MRAHSFSRTDDSREDFVRFAAAMKIPVAGKDAVSEPPSFSEVELRSAWVSDVPSR